jgi:hypothetical protein
MDSYSDLDSDSDNSSFLDISSSASPSPIPSELSSKASITRTRHSVGARIQAITLLELNIPHLEITAQTGISKAQIYSLREKAISQGWDPKISRIVEVHHVEDTLCSGRPKTSQDIIDLILKTVTQNSTTRGWSCTRIAHKVSSIPRTPSVSVSGSTVWRVLRRNGYCSYKRTVKPGLKLEDKAKRLKWCLDHRAWTFEDWKNVIWTDETSVQLGSVRGKRRVWRKSDEAYHPHVITRRWKGFQELMWWSCFTYNEKGPFHI